MIKCEFCNSCFKTVSALNSHKIKAKYCLLIQNKIEPKNIVKDPFKCFNCNKILSSKRSSCFNEGWRNKFSDMITEMSYLSTAKKTWEKCGSLFWSFLNQFLNLENFLVKNTSLITFFFLLFEILIHPFLFFIMKYNKF